MLQHRPFYHLIRFCKMDRVWCIQLVYIYICFIVTLPKRHPQKYKANKPNKNKHLKSCPLYSTDFFLFICDLQWLFFIFNLKQPFSDSCYKSRAREQFFSWYLIHTYTCKDVSIHFPKCISKEVTEQTQAEFDPDHLPSWLRDNIPITTYKKITFST